MEFGIGPPDFFNGFPILDHDPVFPALREQHREDIGRFSALREDFTGFIRSKGEVAAGEPGHEVMVRELPERGSEECAMIPVLFEKIPDVPVMGKIALPGSGHQELPPAGRHFFEEEHPLAGPCRFGSAEEPGRPSPNNDHGIIVHHRNYSLRQLFDVSEPREYSRSCSRPAFPISWLPGSSL